MVEDSDSICFPDNQQLTLTTDTPLPQVSTPNASVAMSW
jgi:hypothetical protein